MSKLTQKEVREILRGQGYNIARTIFQIVESGDLENARAYGEIREAVNAFNEHDGTVMLMAIEVDSSLTGRALWARLLEGESYGRTLVVITKYVMAQGAW